MRADLTDITVVLDRSGSMSSCRTDAEGGLNTFIEQQKGGTGEAVFTLVQFDTDYEFVHRAVPIKSVPPCTLIPRGGTALLDAVGRSVTETGERLAAITEDQRPGLVVFVILTDGQENSSKEFKQDAIRAMIERQTKDYNWQFVFLGANQDAFAAAGGIGIAKSMAANYSEQKTSGALRATSSNVLRSRSLVSSGMAADMSYSDSQRAELCDPKSA